MHQHETAGNPPSLISLHQSEGDAAVHACASPAHGHRESTSTDGVEPSRLVDFGFSVEHQLCIGHLIVHRFAIVRGLRNACACCVLHRRFPTMSSAVIREDVY